MAQEIITQANALFVDENYEEALEKFGDALKLEPSNGEIYAKRANCQLQLHDYLGATQDACFAIQFGQGTIGHFRKGVAAFELEEFESALENFTMAEQLKPSTVNNMWIRKCKAELEESTFVWS